VKALCRFAVPVFVLMSGFYLSLNARNERAWPFYHRTLKRLLIPYVVYSAVYLAASKSGGGNVFWLWVSALLHGTAYGHLWFIPVIVELYLVHPFLRRWYRSVEYRGRFCGMAFVLQVCCAVAGELAAPRLSHYRWLADATVILSFLPYVGYFTLGYLLLDYAADFRVTVRRPAIRAAAVLIWSSAAGAIGAYTALPLLWSGTWGAVPYPGLALKLLAPILSAAAFVVIADRRPGMRSFGPAARIVQSCGLYAFGVYFLHPLVLLVVSWGLTEAVGLNWNSVAFYVLALPLVSVASVLAVRLLAKVPFARYLA
jgi:surface polysaccharide O-acyltransferase-like enzyme